jgi:GTP-binding protein Era
MNEQPFRTGYLAIVGRPNVGKSTLTNRLVGAKVSITSRKAQTTRHRIHGVLTQEDCQFIFVDTPGFQTKHRNALNRLMNRSVTQTLADVDVVLFMVEAGKWGIAPLCCRFSKRRTRSSRLPTSCRSAPNAVRISTSS